MSANANDLASLFARSKAVEMPADVVAKQQGVARRQRLADMLTNMAFAPTPTQMVGPVAVRQSPFEAIARTFAGGLAGHKQKNIDTDLQGIANDYQQAQRQAIADALSKPTEREQAQAMLSRPDLPAVYEQGQNMLKELQQRQTTFGKEAMSGMTNQGKMQAAQTGSFAGGQTLQDKAQEYDPNKLQIDPTTGQPLAATKGSVGQVMSPQGSLLNKNLHTGALDSVDKATKVNVGTSAQVFAEKKGIAKAIDLLSEDEKNLQESQNMLGVLNDMEQLDKAGMYNSTGAPQIMELVKLGQALGLNYDKDKLANAEAYRAAQVQLWQNLISKMGGNRGVTAEEAKEIKQMLPRINDSPEGRARILSILRKSHQRAVQRYKMSSEALQKGLGAEDATEFFRVRGERFDNDVQPEQPKIRSWDSF